jgi:hypothetical protein
MAELEADSVNSSTCAALKEVHSHKFECQNCVVVEFELLQKVLNKNQEHGNIEPPPVGVREGSVENYHGDWNLVNSNHVIKTANILRHIPLPFETSNPYSLLDNLQGTSRNLSNGDVMNGELTKQVTPNVNYSSLAKIHHTQSKKVAKYESSPNQQHNEHKKLHPTQLNLQEFADGHVKLLCAEEESTYHIPTFVNGVIITGARDGIASSGNDKLIPSNSDPLVNSYSKPPSQKCKRKLLITGDSHARGCATRVKNLTDDKFEICGFVKPGSGVNILTKSAKH